MDAGYADPGETLEGDGVGFALIQVGTDLRAVRANEKPM
jgi:hypothetical protein